MQLLFKKFGASDMMTALLFSTLPSAIGIIIGPIVSYKSDRLRSRWGRRIPFLIVPVPFIVISMVGLAFCPQLGDRLSHFLGPRSPGLDGSVIILMGIFWTMFEVSCITGNSIFGALVNDVVPQAVVGRFYGLFRAVGLIAGIAFFFHVMGQAEAHFSWIFLGIGAIYGVGFLLMCLNVKEGEYPPLPAVPARERGHFFAIRTYFKAGLGNSYYLWFFAATILGGLCSFPFNLYSLFYAKSIGMSMDTYGKCIALTYTCSLFLSYPLGILADRFHPLRVSMAAMAVYALVMIGGGLLVRDASTFGVALIVHGVISGCMFTAWASLAQRLLPREKFAEIGSVGGVLGAITGMVMAPLFGVFLDHVHHNYRYTFFACGVLTLAALWAYWLLHRRFMALGGPKSYVAPE